MFRKYFAIPLLVAFLAGISVEFFKLKFLSPSENRSGAVSAPPMPAPTTPTPTPTPVPMTKAPSSNQEKPPNDYLRSGDYVGETTRINTENGTAMSGPTRIWQIKVGPKGKIERANVYVGQRLVYELVVTGSYISPDTFVGKTFGVGNTTYTPDDVTIIVASSRDQFSLTGLIWPSIVRAMQPWYFVAIYQLSNRSADAFPQMIFSNGCLVSNNL
jgi:hypothetical protein